MEKAMRVLEAGLVVTDVVCPVCAMGQLYGDAGGIPVDRLGHLGNELYVRCRSCGDIFTIEGGVR